MIAASSLAVLMQLLGQYEFLPETRM